MTRSFLKAFACICLSLVWPGSGHIAIGKSKVGITFASLPAIVLSAFATSRLIVSTTGFSILLFILIVNYVLSIVLLIPELIYTKTQLPFRRIAFGVGVAIVALSLLGVTFTVKDKLLGFQIYIIPSQSMTPTLEPGDFILVDTWAYRHSTPQLGDVVIFTRPNRNEFYVKRVATWNSGDILVNDQLYLLGDNSTASKDSRHFGGIDRKNVRGQVTGVVVSFDNRINIKIERVLIGIE